MLYEKGNRTSQCQLIETFLEWYECPVSHVNRIYQLRVIQHKELVTLHEHHLLVNDVIVEYCPAFFARLHLHHAGSEFGKQEVWQVLQAVSLGICSFCHKQQSRENI